MSSPKSLFSKTVSKKPRIDNEEKQENTTSQNTGRNIPSSSVRKPAFNPALLSSAFYTGPTMYGGAGACSSSSPVNQYAKSKFYDRKKSDIKVTPSTPEASMSQTSRRILDLLEQYSSPISDAKRIPINNRPTFNTLKKTLNTSSIFDISKKSVYEDSPTPNSSKAHRFRELQIPSMATLMKIKKNNRTGENSQAAIMASMSSSMPYKPETYSLRSAADNNTYKSKIKTKVSSTRSKMIDEDEMAIPVNLPNISLNMTGLPTFTMEPFKPHINSTNPYIPDKKDTHNFNSASNFKFTSPVAIGKGDISVEARKFQFSEPLDIFSADYVPTQEEADTSGSLKGDSLFRSVSAKPIHYSDTLSNVRSNKVDYTSPVINFKSGDSDTPKSSGKRPAEQWNGNDSGKNRDSEKIPLVNGDSKSYDMFGKSSHSKSDHGVAKDSSYDEVLNPNVKKLKTDSVLTQSPILGLESFIKKQQEQWECSSCMTRNEQSKLKCACCEAAKPGAATPAVAPVALPAAAPAPPKALANPPYSGMASFIQKQQEQWECSCCMSRNDQNRAKCVCCEAAKPGAQPAAAAAVQFNFGNTQNTFKFGIDKATDPGKTVTDGKVAEPTKKPDTAVSGGGFMFGNPTTLLDPKSDSVPVGGFKFGVTNGSSPSITTTPVSKPLMFGSKNQESSPSVPVSEFSFGIKKAEENKVTETSTAPAEIKTNLFSFSSPKLANENKKEIENPKVNFAVTQNDTKAPPPLYSKPVDTAAPAATVPTTSLNSPPAFSFGASVVNKPVFGNSPSFQFGSHASSPPAPATTESSIKPGLFSFGAKPSAVPTNDTKPATDANAAPKPAFQLQSATSGSLFPSATSQVTNNSVKSPLPGIGGGIQFNAPATTDKPNDQAAPAFFGFTSPTANSAGIGGSTFKSPTSTLPAFSFGSTSTTKVESVVPLFSAPAATNAPATGIFGSKPAESSMFKGSPITTTSSFPAPSSNIFGSVQSVNSQLPASNMFGSGSLSAAASKPPVAIFGSSSLSTEASSQPSQANSLFSNPTMPAPSFNAGSIFGNTAQSGSVPPQTGNLFGNPVKSPSDTNSGMFMSNPQAAAPPSNMFGLAMAATAPTQTSSTIFSSSPAVPTPVFGASIPFGEASQNQNVSFKFGASSSSGPPGVGFGGGAAPGGVFSFGSGAPAPLPTNSQFNFSMGAPASAFSNTPGAMANPAQRRIKKAVRRNVLR